MDPMDTYLVISAVGSDRPGLLDRVANAVRECGCNIGDSRMALLGSEFTLMTLVSGHWNAIAKLEQALPRLAGELDLELTARRTEPRSDTAELIPYGVEVVGLDRPGILHDVARFFARREVTIEDAYSARYPAPHTGAPLFSLQLTVGIPATSSLATVRGEFMDFCDDLNLDAMLAPVK